MPKKGFKFSEESKLKMRNSHLGMKRPDSVKEKIRIANIGIKNPFYGKKHSEETRKKMVAKHKRGSESHFWKDGRSSDKDYINWLKNRRNRIIKRGGIGGHSWSDWETLKAQYNWTCPCCKRKEPEIKLTQDHIVAISKGGSDNIENIQPLCARCNSVKHNKTIIFLK